MKLILCTLTLLFSHFTYSDPFMAGSKSVGLKLGTSSIGNERYTVAGASLQYFAINNLSLGVAYEYWFSGKPTISKGTLESTYYLPLNNPFKPYFGLLYSHYFVENISDIDAYGYRAGVAYIKSPMIVSAGVRQEKYSSNSPVFFDQDPTIEFMLGLSF